MSPGLPERAPFADCQSFVAAGGALVPRLLVATITFLVAAAIGWMAWASVEETVAAFGHARPSGLVKLVNHPHGGKVAEIMVAEGQEVAAGAVLVQLDDAIARSDHEEVLGRLQVLQAEVSRLDAEAHELGMAAPAELLAARPDLVDAQLRLLQARRETMRARRQALEEAVDGRRAAVATVTAERERAGEALGHLDGQLSAIRELADRGLYPRLRLAAAEKQLADARGERRKAETELASAQAGLAEARARLQSFDQEWRSDLLDQLTRATAERDRLQEQLASRLAVLEALEIRSPVAGIVLDLKVTGPGQSIPANSPIMKIVPGGDLLTFEVRVQNEDIGKVHPGMAAVVKVRALDYLRFGTLDGRVTRIAADATVEEATGRRSYVVTIASDRQQLGAGPEARPIVPGMLVDVELEAGERTILSYLTDRIWHARDRAFKEG